MEEGERGDRKREPHTHYQGAEDRVGNILHSPKILTQEMSIQRCRKRTSPGQLIQLQSKNPTTSTTTENSYQRACPRRVIEDKSSKRQSKNEDVKQPQHNDHSKTGTRGPQPVQQSLRLVQVLQKRTFGATGTRSPARTRKGGNLEGSEEFQLHHCLTHGWFREYKSRKVSRVRMNQRQNPRIRGWTNKHSASVPQKRDATTGSIG